MIGQDRKNIVHKLFILHEQKHNAMYMNNTFIHAHECMIAVNISIVVVDKKFKSHGELMCTGKILQACTCSLGGGGGEGATGCTLQKTGK